MLAICGEGWVFVLAAADSWESGESPDVRLCWEEDGCREELKYESCADAARVCRGEPELGVELERRIEATKSSRVVSGVRETRAGLSLKVSVATYCAWWLIICSISRQAEEGAYQLQLFHQVI
jgi:hypothetical protein